MGVTSLAAIIAIGYFARRYGAAYCLDLKAANLAKEVRDRTPIDCAEFWFNRYQSAWSQITAAAVALFAAWLAWRAVQAQIAAQNRATHLAEVEFWESKAETSASAIVALSTMRTNLKALQIAREAHKTGQNVNIRACQIMRANGFYPFASVDATSVGAESAYYINFVSLLSGQIARLDSGPGSETLAIIDRALAGLFLLLPPVEAAVDQASARHERQHARAVETLKRLVS